MHQQRAAAVRSPFNLSRDQPSRWTPRHPDGVLSGQTLYAPLWWIAAPSVEAQSRLVKLIHNFHWGAPSVIPPIFRNPSPAFLRRFQVLCTKLLQLEVHSERPPHQFRPNKDSSPIKIGLGNSHTSLAQVWRGARMNQRESRFLYGVCVARSTSRYSSSPEPRKRALQTKIHILPCDVSLTCHTTLFTIVFNSPVWKVNQSPLPQSLPTSCFLFKPTDSKLKGHLPQQSSLRLSLSTSSVENTTTNQRL